MKKDFSLEELFKKAKESNPVVSSEDAIGRFKESASSASNTNTVKKTQFFTKKFIIMYSTIITISASIFFSLPSNKTASEKETPNVDASTTIVEETENHETIKKTSVKVPKVRNSKKGFSIPSLSVKEISTIYVSKFDIMEIDRGVRKLPKPPFQLTDQKYYPKLTPDEIKANHKQKKKMLKSLAKFDKKSYVYVPSGTMKIGSQVTSVQAFYMGVNEVTNLEYRTFMFDLIIQNRKSDFDIARPEQEKWTTTLNDSTTSMEKNYFSHPAFDNYPVVNITKEGAELYCKWLTLELVKVYGNEFNDVRIPVKDEWVFAASVEGKALPYPWGSAEIKNESGCFLANFDAHNDFPKNGSFMLGQDGATFTAKVGTYNPNELGLYNISGNVAELAYDSKWDEKGLNVRSDALVQCGGGWMDSLEDLKIDAPKKAFVEANPNIGFRVVMTHLKSKTP